MCASLIITVLSASGSALDSNPSSTISVYYNTGVIVGEEFTCSFKIFDHTGDNIYVFVDWGDDENELVGPIQQNIKINLSHIYDVEGDYGWQLIFNDSQDIFYEFNKTVYVRNIEIGDINGGLRLKVTVKNNGNLSIDVSEGWWGFTFEHRRGMDFWIMDDSELTIAPHDEIILKSKIKTFSLVHLLVGRTKITFSAPYQGLEPKTVDGFIIGPFIFI